MKLIPVLLVLALSACNRTTETKDITQSYVMPPAMKDCHVYRLLSETQKNLWVVDCNNVTSTTWNESRYDPMVHARRIETYTVSRDRISATGNHDTL
jgi:hypothetical protein